MDSVKETEAMLLIYEETQEQRYNLKNAIFLQVMQRPPAQRNNAAFITFKRLHMRVQEKVRSNGRISQEDLIALEYVAELV
jgi:hypothetical protein